MINVDGKSYDGVIIKPDIDEALAHYGVMGMKWGIRRDLRKNGSISKKTKKKISKALSTASYRKTRRMLNGLGDLDADYRGEREFARTTKDTSGIKFANKNIKSVKGISNTIKKSAKNKGYKYDIKKRRRYTERYRKNSSYANVAGHILAGPIGGIGASAGAHVYSMHAGKKHQARYKTNDNPYFINNTDVYIKKKKKK